jgi:hypothetical protein
MGDLVPPQASLQYGRVVREAFEVLVERKLGEEAERRARMPSELVEPLAHFLHRRPAAPPGIARAKTEDGHLPLSGRPCLPREEKMRVDEIVASRRHAHDRVL